MKHRDIVITLKRDGRMKVDIELPEGSECDEVDAKLRVALALLGVIEAPEDIDDRRVPVPDSTKNRRKS